jgi:hypothetical protein
MTNKLIIGILFVCVVTLLARNYNLKRNLRFLAYLAMRYERALDERGFSRLASTIKDDAVNDPLFYV